MSDCLKHLNVPLVSQQVDTDKWEEICPVCQYQDYVKLQERVARLWERIGMPVDDYLPTRSAGSASVGYPWPGSHS